ncbi:MAG: hypothetical protein LBV33_03730 [Lachnospiraceae bacterium]|nr:hypothetical protein [Lachnospiraceae bacterium]
MGLIGTVKAGLKQILIRHWQQKYRIALQQEKQSFHEWITKKEAAITISKNTNDESGDGTRQGLVMAPIPFSLCGQNIWQQWGDQTADIITFYADDGQIAPLAERLIPEFMHNHPAVSLVYGDEDRMGGADRNFERIDPWFKPDWSPDTFLDRFYLGSIFAVRREKGVKVLKAMKEEGAITVEPGRNLYELCRRLAKAGGGFEPGWSVLQNRITGQSGVADRPITVTPGGTGVFNGNERPVPVGHIPEVLYHGAGRPVVWYGADYCRTAGDQPRHCDQHQIAVIIPSKDHPDLLKQCIGSFIGKTTIAPEKKNCHYYFIIVDNGSNEENRRSIEEYLEQLHQEGSGQVDQEWSEQVKCGSRPSFRSIYLYRPMEFNFSAMCNIGAKAVLPDTDLLHFLNDDVTVGQNNWLCKLADQAANPWVGAAGVKLLYPDTAIIQHVGITNLRKGPAHKLQYCSDHEEYYFGQNRGVHNVVAVTGACLMVRAELFAAIGGFDEGLAVALNDVDFCFSLLRAGYVNVVRNDIVLFHHESLSRGIDVLSEEKQRRFERERDRLYERHPQMYNYDPFYHKYLIADTLTADFMPASGYEVNERSMPWSVVAIDRGEVASGREDGCLVFGVEYAGGLSKWRDGLVAERRKTMETGYFLEGYSFVAGSDNACYEKTLLLQSDASDRIFTATVRSRYRPDIESGQPDQINVALAGFCAKFPSHSLPEGGYRLGMMVRDRCSRQTIVNWSERYLQVGGNEKY